MTVYFLHTTQHFYVKLFKKKNKYNNDLNHIQSYVYQTKTYIYFWHYIVINIFVAFGKTYIPLKYGQIYYDIEIIEYCIDI